MSTEPPGRAQETAAPHTAADVRVRQAIRMLEDAQPPFPTAAELADALDISRDYFVRLFREATGQTPNDYLRAFQLDQAAFRLGAGADGVADIYGDYGYASQAAFTRAFTRHHGVSPVAYRRRLRATGDVDPAAAAAVRIVQLPAHPCWTRRYFGPFSARREHWADCLERAPPAVLQDAGLLALNHDDPRLRPPEALRYDCCLQPARPLSKALEAALEAQGFERFQSTAGLYACVAHSGDYVDVGRSYRALLGGWLANQNRYVIAGEPILEVVRTPREDMASERFGVDVCLKVTPKGTDPDWRAGPEQRREAGVVRGPSR